MEWTLTDVLIDFAKVSILLIIATLLRRKIKLFQKWYISSSILAGIIGLLSGKQILGGFSPVCLNFVTIDQWIAPLCAIILGCSFLGLQLKKVSGPALQTYFLSGTCHQLQIIVCLTVTFLLGFVYTDLQLGFGILANVGFYGGHSQAIAAGAIFDEAGYMEVGNQVGATFATIGVLTGIIVGMIAINNAARKGRTTIKMLPADMPRSMMTGFYADAGARPSIGEAVTHSSTLDPLASQLMIVGFIVMVGYILRTVSLNMDPFFKNIPLFVWCLIVSAVFCLCTRKNKWVNSNLDRKTIVRISSTALDYMIVAALANTSLTVFTEYGVPIIIVSVAIGITTYLVCFKLAKLMLPKEGRFETSVGLFGQQCGILATGLMLLKVVDPESETNAMTNITSATALGYTFQLQYLLVLITVLMTRPLFVYFWSWGLLAILLGCGLIFGRRYRREERAQQQTSQRAG